MLGVLLMTTELLGPAPSPPASVRPEARSSRLAGLDGLRAIAVAAVVVFHLFPVLMPGGTIGVDVFFVISGFLITSLLLREREATGRTALRAFWQRRARRLLPALGVLVLVCSLAALVIGGDTVVGLGRGMLGALTFSSNWLSIASGASYFDQTTPDLFRNLWSLAVEEQFYLAWPLLFLLLSLVRRRGVRVWILTACAAASAIAMALLYSPVGDATRVYYGTDTHSFGLAVGALLATVAQGWPQTRLGWSRLQRALVPVPGFFALLALIGVAVVVPSDSALLFRGGFLVVSVLTAVAITSAVIPGSLLGWLLDARPLRWVGERSYGIYLWHWPVVVLVAAALPRWESPAEGGWAVGAVALALTLAAATLSYRFVEQPIRRAGFRAVAAGWFSSGPRRALRIASAVVLILAVGTGGTVSAVAAVRAPEVGSAQANIEAGAAGLADPGPASAPSGSPTPTAVPMNGTPASAAPLVPGASTGPIRPPGTDITAIGDSVMLASAPELQRALPGITIDAVVSRQMRELPDLLESMRRHNTLRPTVVVGLGTNGAIGRDTLEKAVRILGPERQLVLVNVQAPRPWTRGVNQVLAGFAEDYRAVDLARWRSAIAGHLDLLAGDQIHPGAAGGRIYAAAVNGALDRLAALPPYRGFPDYWVAHEYPAR